MVFIARQEDFTCLNCHRAVGQLKSGSYRNHCPACLYSLHVDENGPGDRQSTCHGLMTPVGLDHRPKKGWMIIHRCLKCGKQMPNIAAKDDDLSLLSAEKNL